MNAFIQQEGITLIKSDSNDIYKVTKDSSSIKRCSLEFSSKNLEQNVSMV